MLECLLLFLRLYHVNKIHIKDRQTSPHSIGNNKVNIYSTCHSHAIIWIFIIFFYIMWNVKHIRTLSSQPVSIYITLNNIISLKKNWCLLLEFQIYYECVSIKYVVLTFTFIIKLETKWNEIIYELIIIHGNIFCMFIQLTVLLIYEILSVRRSSI